VTATAFVHGALTSFAIALLVLVAQSWPAPDDSDGCSLECLSCCDAEEWSHTCGFDGVHLELSMCPSEDYRPVPPTDGTWCGVHLDDRHPIRPDSFPTLRLRIPLP
jgi:hypothetical protein